MAFWADFPEFRDACLPRRYEKQKGSHMADMLFFYFSMLLKLEQVKEPDGLRKGHARPDTP